MEENQQITPLLGGHEYKTAKQCPKCMSVFITNAECEACGYQLTFSPLGEAFSEKSFYGLKQRYWEGRSMLVKLRPELERKGSSEAKKYIRSLLHRFDLLLDFLLGESGDEREYYWIELKQLCLELRDYCIPLENLSVKLSGHSFHGYAPLIQQHLNQMDSSPAKVKTRWDFFLNYKFLGILRVQFLFILGITLAAISTASLLVYQYFFLYS